jgi:hypothetical protein
VHYESKASVPDTSPTDEDATARFRQQQEQQQQQGGASC